MKKINVLAMLLALATITFTSCGKDDEPETNTTKTNQQKIEGNSYLLTAWTVSPPVQGTTDIYSAVEECNKDDVTIFQASNVLVRGTGAKLCTQNEMPSQGSWSFNADQSQLTMTIFNKTTVYTILSITDTVIKMQYTQVSGSTTYTFEVTYNKQ